VISQLLTTVIAVEDIHKYDKSPLLIYHSRATYHLLLDNMRDGNHVNELDNNSDKIICLTGSLNFGRVLVNNLQHLRLRKIPLSAVIPDVDEFLKELTV
jgi:hypothetical protein